MQAVHGFTVRSITNDHTEQRINEGNGGAYRLALLSLLPLDTSQHSIPMQGARSLSQFSIKYSKVKRSRYRPSVAQSVGRGIALLFHDRGTRRGLVVSSTPRLHFTRGKEPVPILQEAGWTPGPVWTGGKSRRHLDSIPDHPACSQSLYRLSYRAHNKILFTEFIYACSWRGHCVKQPLYRPSGFRQFEFPIFHDNRYVKVVRLLALGTGHIYPQEVCPVLISVGGGVNPRVIVRAEGMCH